jgi:hypothetical protein
MGTVNRKPYLTSSVLDQAFLDECQDNLTNQLELIVDLETPDGYIYLSDRNKYVGDTFYEARLNFPVISRTIGEYLNPTIEFSQLTLEISNVDGFLNHMLPSGADYTSWIGRAVSIKLGLRDIASTYTEIFSGKVTEEGGFQRSTSSITLVFRNEFSQLNTDFPKAVFKRADFPWIEDENENTISPIIYGDWNNYIEPNGASVPAIVMNGADSDVNGDTSNTLVIELIIANHALKAFDQTEVYLFRGSAYYKFDPADIQGVTDNRYFEIRQSGTTPPGVTLVDGAAYAFKMGDKFFVKVKGKDLGAYDDNIISQAEDILINEVGMAPGLLDSSWAYFKNKALPVGSDIINIKSRIWIRDPQQGLTYVLSLLEQVRLEAFINRNGKLALSSLHFDEFELGSYTIKNWDIEKGSMSPRIDDKLNFNRVRGSFNYLPNRNENYNETLTYRNDPAITQIGKEISKRIVYPNLYIPSQIEYQIKETLKITSSYLEIITMNLTWRSLLQDIGNFVRLNINIEGIVLDNVPGLIREIGYDPQGIKIYCVVWSFQMVPFLPTWNPGYAGIVGGDTATITSE